MARVLIVYYRDPTGRHWRSTYTSHLSSFQRFSEHECFYLNTAMPTIPEYLKHIDFDLVIFHYAFLAVRQVPDIFAREIERISFIKDLRCRKALIPHDEQAHADLLNEVVNEFGVTHVFTPASAPQWPQIYRDTDLERISFTSVLTGYVDDATVRMTAKRASRHHGRPIDVGYRSWWILPSYGRHGLLKREIGKVFQQRAPEFGLIADISSDPSDALLGDCWFDFLLDCKYTVGVEGGSSILDWDGSIAQRTRDFLERHEGATFEEVEAACFPGTDGTFDYRLLGPRHLEAVMTRTGQVLMEGHYGGALEPGSHYIEVKRDFSNLHEVLRLMKDDELRESMVERAYQDVVASGAWSYRAFVQLVFSEALRGFEAGAGSERPRFALLRNRAENSRAFERVADLVSRGVNHGARVLDAGLSLLERFGPGATRTSRSRYSSPERYHRTPREFIRDTVVLSMGEERVWRLLIGLRSLVRHVKGQPPLDAGEYVPTKAEAARRARRDARRR